MSLRILSGPQVEGLLAGQRERVVEIVRRAYLAHERGESSLPHSSFLRFPGDDVNRIIALPAYVGGELDAAGIKWIASFPGNLERGMARASAVLVLNSCETGRPRAILESSVISAWRTAASAALAARELTGERPPATVGLVGTGLIGHEIVRFLDRVLPGIERLVLFDLDRDRAKDFAGRLRSKLSGDLETEIADSVDAVLAACPLVAFATTASQPHVEDLEACPPGAVILHVSLRDLSVDAILAADNVVDDPDHVARAQTSIHLAEQRTGSRGFIRSTLGRILERRAPAKPDPEQVTVFSPFGLGVLDLAVARFVLDRAGSEGTGTLIESFFPAV